MNDPGKSGLHYAVLGLRREPPPGRFRPPRMARTSRPWPVRWMVRPGFLLPWSFTWRPSLQRGQKVVEVGAPAERAQVRVRLQMCDQGWVIEVSGRLGLTQQCDGPADERL